MTDRIVVDHPLVHAPGIFFGLPDSDYHAAFALSASGIKNMRVSTLDFWWSSALNPEPEERNTEALHTGRAYDKRIVEGREAFYRLYAPELDAMEHPDALRTNEEIRAAIIAAGGPTKGLSGLRKAEMVDQLLRYAPDAQVWETMLAEHAAKHPGREFLPFRLVRQIEMAAAMVENHHQLCKAFTGGVPQPSIFWTDEKSGVPFKAKIDYLKPRAIIDLKTAANVNRLPVKTAVAHAIANYRYHVQAALYLRAAHQARRMACEGLVYLDRLAPGSTEARTALAVAAGLKTETRPFEFLFVVQMKGPAPVARGRVLGEGSTLDIARQEIDEATKKFVKCWSTFGVDPWADIEDIDTIDDSEMPSYMAAA